MNLNSSIVCCVLVPGIIVAIRIRPLQDNARRVWKLLPAHSSITQTDPKTGQPTNKPITGKTFFTFDRTFGEDIGTSEIYESVAKRIVSSFLVSGLNGTIFAYGQTSSGKTYTMQGAGSIQEGAGGAEGGGVVHMAATDIFNHIEKQQQQSSSSSKDGGGGRRVYTVRASFLEIYNEEVRDLLSTTNEALPIREDKKRGVFVQSVEQEASDRDGLLQILFQGEKSRAVASTGMNERSSRSHTIFRVTIESHSTGGGDDDDGGDGSGDKENQCPPGSSSSSGGGGAIRISTLNLVDLAGSESVRHTGATGDRQKEGGMINQR
jgi:centromeric protein E